MPKLHFLVKAYFYALFAVSALFLSIPDVLAANRVVLGNASATTLASSADAHITRTLKSLRDKVAKEEKIRVIVGVRAAFSAEGELNAADVAQQRKEIAAAQLAVQEKIPSLKISKEKIKTYSTIPFMALEIDAAELEALTGQIDITSIEEDRIVHATLAQSVPLIGGSAVWSRGYTGAGQTIAILDTGVEKSHPFFTGKVVSEACYSTNSVPAGATSLCPGGVTTSTAAGSGVNCDPALAGCFHGTHVAGIAAGAGASFSGVAKDASIIAMQIFSRFVSTATCGSSTPCIATYTSDYNLALERVFALRSTYNIAAVNMSIGGSGYSNQALCDANYSATKTAIDNLRSVNIATIIASGNESLTNQISAPGCISTAVSVGATSKTDVVASYSNSASFLKLLAPGSAITSAFPGSAYATVSGTSMAAPHVAGAWALLKQQNASRSVTDTLSLLTATGVSITDAKSGVTTPRIRLDVALNAVPTLAYSSESGYGSIGVNPASGTASTLFTYKVVYTDAANTPPTLVRACIDGTCNTMSADASAAAALRDSSYINGEQYVYSAALAAGAHTYYFTATDGTTTVNLPTSGNLSGPAVSNLTITTSTLPDGAVGTAYSQALAATGGVSPYTWSSTTLPAGLSLDVNAGIISGIPAAAGLTGFSASVTDAASAVLSKALSINVGKASQVITLSCTASLSAGSTGICSVASSSGLPVSLTSITPGICTVSGSTIITSFNLGTCTIAANQAGNDNYNPAPPVMQSIVVAIVDNFNIITPLGFAPATVTLGSTTVISASASSGLPISFSSVTSTVCSVGVSTQSGSISSAVVTALNGGTCTIAANQAGNALYEPAASVMQNIMVGVADLVVSAVNKVATSVGVGHSFDITTSVKNQGSTNIVPSFTVGIYLSKDSAVSPATDILIGSRVTSLLPVTPIEPVLPRVTLPYSTAPGVYYVGACADITNVVREFIESNNCKVATGTITVVRAVNLQMSTVSKTAAVVGVGRAFSLTNTEKNVGTTHMTAASNTVKFYLSTDATITTADIAIGSRAVSRLLAGQSNTQTTVVTVPATVLPRAYYVGVCADTANVQIETVETDNCRAALGTITVVRNVDLVMSVVSTTATTIKAGGNLVISNTERNQGMAGMLVGSTNKVNFYLSTDATITSADILLTGSRTVSALAAGASSTASTMVTVPANVLPRVYYIGAIADGGNQLLESVENNNARTGGTITIN